MRVYIVGDVDSEVLYNISKRLIQHPQDNKLELYVYTRNSLRYMEKLRDIILNNILLGLVIYERKLDNIVDDLSKLNECNNDFVLIGKDIPQEILDKLRKVIKEKHGLEVIDG